MEIVSIARSLLGAILLLYSANCWFNQKYWSRKHFDWRPKEHWPGVFWANVIGGAFGGTYLLVSSYL